MDEFNSSYSHDGGRSNFSARPNSVDWRGRSRGRDRLARRLRRRPGVGAQGGFISPRTGALAGFGENDGYILELVRKALSPGLKVGEKTFAVDILDRDTRSDPSRAGQLAKTLINSDKIDMMLCV